MPGADDWARASDMNAHLKWPSADDGDRERSEETAPTVRGFFLGQLSDDEPEDVSADEAEDVWADDPPEGEEEVDGADLEGVLPDGEQDLDPFARSFETELHYPIATDGDETELSVASVADEPTRVATGAVPSVGARQALRAARQRRGRARLSRVALVAGVVAALAGGTAVYVGTHAKADDHHASRPTSTSFEQRSSPTTPTTAFSSAAAPGTEPAPDPAAVPGSAAPTASARDALGAGRGARQRRTDLAAGAGLDHRAAEHRRSAQLAATAKPDVSGAPGPLPLARDGGGCRARCQPMT